MKYYLLCTTALISANVYGSVYFDLALGGVYKDLKGETNSYKAAPGAAGEFALGLKGERWDFGIETMYSYGRQKDLVLNYNSTPIRDDFNWHNFSIGPTIKYQLKTSSEKYSYIPFVGVFVNHASFTNRVDLRDDITNRTEDADHDILGYGGKFGFMIKQATGDDSWLDSINYKFYGSYTKHQKMEGDYKENGRILEYKGNSPDKLSDISVGFLVGFTVGDKLWNRTKAAVGLD